MRRSAMLLDGVFSSVGDSRAGAAATGAATGAARWASVPFPSAVGGYGLPVSRLRHSLSPLFCSAANLLERGSFIPNPGAKASPLGRLGPTTTNAIEPNRTERKSNQ